MSDKLIFLPYFAILMIAVLAAAIAGKRAAGRGLTIVFATSWTLLMVAWSFTVPAWQFTLPRSTVIGVIFLFALALVFVPMSLARNSGSFVKLFALGAIGAAVSSVVSLFFALTVVCLLFGDCL